MIGKTVWVYDRNLFAVPVRARIESVSTHDGAYQVTFFPTNPGGHNVTKFNGKYFFPEQCSVIDEGPSLGHATTKELLDEIHARIEVDGKLGYRSVEG